LVRDIERSEKEKKTWPELPRLVAVVSLELRSAAAADGELTGAR
jgi:hypothetical protein